MPSVAKREDEMARRGASGGRMKVEERREKTHFGVAKLEERKDPRFFVNLPIEYYRIESPVRAAGPLLNVSEGGVMAYVPEQLKVGQYLLLKLFFSRGSDLEIVELLSEVIWAENQGQEKDYRCGLRFVNINPENMSKLNDFLNNLWETPS
jgi:c-di-GMP-binding flagellar brake protein YcgR